MEIDPQDLGNRERYRLMTASLIPRPIAWLSTVDAHGRANLAPFSFFGGVSSHPPTVMVSIGPRRGQPKDTAKNLMATGEAVIHIPHRSLAEKMVTTSAEVGSEVDEFDLAGLTKVASVLVEPPRVAEAAIAMEAKVVHHQHVGSAPMDLFLLELLRFHFDDAVIKDGMPDAMTLGVVGRLGGQEYCETAAVFEIPRPL